jgi:lysophospholipase L1-like esterase
MTKTIRDLLVILVVTFAGVEAGLRFAPGIIPLNLLINFSADARAEIAERRNLATERHTVQVARDDGGPPLRVFPPHQQVGKLFTDQHAVASVMTDETGFCNVPLADGARRQAELVAVGDSFTWCTAVRPQDAWVSRLGEITGLDAYNLGLGGVGIYEYLQILTVYGLRLQPRTVLLNYYEGNDLRDALVYRKHREGGGDPAAEAKPGLVGRIKQSVHGIFDATIVGRSYAANLALASAIQAYLTIKDWWGVAEPVNFRYAFRFPDGRMAFNLENTDLDEVAHARALRDGRISLAVLEDGLRRFIELGRRHGFEPVVLYTPSAYTAYGDYVEFEDPALGELMPWFSQAQRDFLRSKGEVLGYRFVDLTPALQQAASEHGGRALLYFPTNVHLSQLGNDVVAKALADVLARDIPSRPTAVRSPGQSSDPLPAASSMPAGSSMLDRHASGG